jgi:hypothetical protein
MQVNSEVVENETGRCLRVNIWCHAGSPRQSRDGFTEYDESTVVRASEVGGSVLYDADLVVVGGPTQVRSMSRPSTRKGAPGYAKKHGGELALEPALTTRLACGSGLVISGSTPSLLRPSTPASWARPPSLAGPPKPSTEAWLVTRCLSWPESFLVDKNGRLLPGEVARAAAWGATLALAVRARRAAAV